MDQLELDQVLTDTFVGALQSASPKGSSDKHDGAWLIGILRRQVCAHYRNKYRSKEAIANARKSTKQVLNKAFDIPKKLEGIETNVLSQSGNQSFWNAFNECIAMLSEVHAEVFILRDLEDISVEEVCGIFGLSRSDVLELVYRARMTVLACLVKNLNS